MMHYDKLNATVSGKTCEGEEFTEELTFKMLPPKEGEAHYGTGYYMTVDMSLSGRQLLDVWYERTTDVEILADRFIRTWYGDNAREITKRFPEEEGQT